MLELTPKLALATSYKTVFSLLNDKFNLILQILFHILTHKLKTV